MNGGETSEVVNLFETEQYAQLCGVMHDWYQKGYTSKDIQTQTDGFTTLVQNDAAFSTVGQADFNTAFYQSTTCRKDMGVVLLDTPVARTYNNVTYTVMSDTDSPEACVKFLNLWFSNIEVGNLISYGIEGVHYQLNEMEWEPTWMVRMLKPAHIILEQEYQTLIESVGRAKILITQQILLKAIQQLKNQLLLDLVLILQM